MTTRTLYLVRPESPVSTERAARLCPVCGHGKTDWTCTRCGAGMHEPCYWGRVASLAEWQDYLTRWLEPVEWNDNPVPVACLACRAREEQSS